MTSRRSRAPRRRMIWSRLRTGETNIAASSAATFLIVNASTNVSFHEATVTRLVGTVFLRMTDAGPWVDAAYSMGIVTVGERAVAAGISAVPDPSDPEGHDWMYWRNSQLTPVGVPTDGSTNVYVERIEIDIKSQRRLREAASDLVLVVRNEISEAVLGVTIGLNALLKVA